MESNSDSEEEKTDCPICGEFVGGVKSVRQHITRSEDEAHKGEDGADYVPVLKERAGRGLDLPENPFSENGEIDQGELDEVGSEDVEKAKMEETEEGDPAVTITAVGVTALVLWWLAKGGLDQNRNQGPEWY